MVNLWDKKLSIRLLDWAKDEAQNFSSLPYVIVWIHFLLGQIFLKLSLRLGPFSSKTYGPPTIFKKNLQWSMSRRRQEMSQSCCRPSIKKNQVNQIPFLNSHMTITEEQNYIFLFHQVIGKVKTRGKKKILFLLVIFLASCYFFLLFFCFFLTQ